MLKITEEERRGWATLRLEGALAGPWVQELERCWLETRVCPEQVVVDLGAVTSVDAEGKALLLEMHTAGTQLQGGGIMVSYILEQIQQQETA